MLNQIAKRIISTLRRADPRPGKRNRSISGATAIEFALTGTILAIMLICTIDLGMGFYRKMQVQNAAQIGAQYAAGHEFDQAAIENAIASATGYPSIVASPVPTKFCGCPSNAGVTNVACNATCPGGVAAGTYVVVSTRVTYTTILPYPILPDTFIFASQSTVRIQ